MTTRNAVGAMPAAEDTPLAISAATRLGASAGAKLPPTCATVTAKSAEAIGVPNSAENSAAMPHTAAHRRPAGDCFSQLPMVQPMLPPICRAAPSRPAEPPHRWVSTAPRKMAGVKASGRGLPCCTVRNTSSVPRPWHRST